MDKLDGKIWFWINGKGEVVITPKYDTPLNYQDLCVFKSGKATVSKSDTYGAIDTTGKVVIKFSHDQLGRINSLIPYKKKELWGYINLNGKSIVDPIYNYAEDINPVLKDRIYEINVNGYSYNEKLELCLNYLIPNIMSHFSFKKNDIIFIESAIKYIINNYSYEDH